MVRSKLFHFLLVFKSKQNFKPFSLLIWNIILLAKNIIGGFASGNKMIVAVSELTSAADIEALALELEKILN